MNPRKAVNLSKDIKRGKEGGLFGSVMLVLSFAFASHSVKTLKNSKVSFLFPQSHLNSCNSIETIPVMCIEDRCSFPPFLISFENCITISFGDAMNDISYEQSGCVCWKLSYNHDLSASLFSS